MRLLVNSFKVVRIERQIKRKKIKKIIKYNEKKNNFPVNIDKTKNWKLRNDKTIPFLL